MSTKRQKREAVKQNGWSQMAFRGVIEFQPAGQESPLSRWCQGCGVEPTTAGRVFQEDRVNQAFMLSPSRCAGCRAAAQSE
mmetsp:Transcript_4439/g.10300  ORF Transcript_4439/g.10300 Transcript_4439/m.10300 type:complete len:81 (-) Transcript_4439:853-1095(-)